jgi:hypothetical protein
MQNNEQEVQVCDPSGLRPQVSNKLRLFLTCALGKLQRLLLISEQNFKRSVQLKLNSSTKAGNTNININNIELSHTK